MLRGVLDRIGELGNLVPRYTGPRCLLERHAVGGCSVCVDVCPHEAVRVNDGGYGVEIDPERCTGCGLCVSGCPTGALEYDLLTPLESVREQRGGAQHGASLTCPQSGAGGPALPCLGRVTPALLSAAGAWDVPLTLIHGDCAACPVGSAEVPAGLARVREETERLRAATGQPARVTIRRATPEDRDRRHQVTRRGAFATLLRAGTQQALQSLPERPLPFVDWSEPAQRTPDEWAWRRRTLKPEPAPEVGIHWPAPVVDDSCIDCPVCANVCPTEAITRDLQPDGSVRLLLDLGACTGCMACLRSCPPGAIHEQPAWLGVAFELPILLREGDTVMERR